MSDQQRQPKLVRLTLYAALVSGSVLMLVPLTWMVLTSFKSFPEVLADPPQWLPEHWNIENYRIAFTEFAFLRYLLNSLFITACVLVGTLLTTIMSAYAFACLHFPKKHWIFGLLLSSMMLPGQVTIIPLFKWYSALGWINTYLPLIAPSFLGTNIFAIFLVRQFFLTIPRDYIEAARLDGASEWRILWTIYVPLSAPVLLTVTVFTFLGSWNDLWGPLIFLHDEAKYTLPVGLLNFLATSQQVQGTPWQLVMAVACVMMLPIVIIFFLAQKRFIEGIATSGVKG